MDSYHRSAVAFGDLKNAALYFDHLVPVLAATEFLRETDWVPFSTKVLRELLPPSLIARPGFSDALAEVNQRTFNLLSKIAFRTFSLEQKKKGFSEEEYDRIEEDAANAYFYFVNQFDLSNWPLAAVGDAPIIAGMPDDEIGEPLPLLTLSRLSVVDASKLPWEQIYEIRKDPVARDRLRRLRLFAFENYGGKSPAFIEDDLLKRIYDYEASARASGLETVQGALSFVLNSKVAAGALAGSLVSAWFGQPVTALIAATTGTILEVAGFALEFQRRRLAIESLARENPVSYISHTRKQVKKT